MSSQPPLFDDVPRDAQHVVPARRGVARPAHVAWLQGLLATWVLGPGVKPTTLQARALQDVAEDALKRAAELSPEIG